MYINILIIVSITTFALARPSDGQSDDDHQENYHQNIRRIERECSELTGYTEDDLLQDIGSKNFMFCQKESAKSWLTCFYQKIGLMDDGYKFQMERLRHSFLHAGEKSESFEGCVNEAMNKDNNERACTFDDCAHVNNLTNYEDEFDEHDNHNLHKNMKECFELTGYPEDKFHKDMDMKNFSFCREEPSRNWLTCLYMKTGGMDEQYVFNEEMLLQQYLHDKDDLETYNKCMNEAKNKDNNVKACSLDDCIHENHLISYDEEFDESHDHEK